MNDQLAGQVLEALNDKVDIDYGNMPANSTNYAPSSKNVTNCITEIPQDIKLELSSDGVLTLKAGSKVYIPNGPGVFDTYITPNDLTYTRSGIDTLFLFIRTDTYTIGISGSNVVSSGSVDSLPGTTYHAWYDTTNNLIKRYATDTSVPACYYSLPIAIIKVGETQIESIYQVFNGFGYIGSTVFVLPGVKALIPDGRNKDGTVKNRSMTIQSVLTKTIPSNTGWHFITLASSGTDIDVATNYYCGAELPGGATSYSRFYNIAENLTYTVVSGKLTKFAQFILDCYIDHSTSSPYKINSMKQATAFNGVDCNDTDFIANQAMPSNKYIDLTLGATDSYYTAPVDGWFFISKNVSANQFVNGYIVPDNNTSRIVGVTKLMSVGGAAAWTLPASKGQRLFLTYTASGTTNYFRFIYANGSK